MRQSEWWQEKGGEKRKEGGREIWVSGDGRGKQKRVMNRIKVKENEGLGRNREKMLLRWHMKFLKRWQFFALTANVLSVYISRNPHS